MINQEITLQEIKNAGFISKEDYMEQLTEAITSQKEHITLVGSDPDLYRFTGVSSGLKEEFELLKALEQALAKAKELV